MKASDLFVECLKVEGIDLIYGVMDGNEPDTAGLTGIPPGWT